MKSLNFILLTIVLLLSACNKEDSSPNELIITPTVGIGNIDFNSTGDDVISEYETYERLTAIRTLNESSFVMWYENGLAFQLNHIEVEGLSLQEIVDMSDELIDLNQKVIQMIIMSPSKAKTVEGIARGSSRADVVAAYGEPSSFIGDVEVYDNINANFWYSVNGEVNRIDLKPN